MATKAMKRYRDGRRWLNVCLSSYSSSIPSGRTFPTSSLPTYPVLVDRKFATTSAGPTQTILPDSFQTSNDWLLQRTSYFLDPTTTLDATDSQLWSDAFDVLQGWLADDNPSSALHRVDCCLRLLDRLVSIMPSGEVCGLEYVFETKILHDLLTTWKRGIEWRDPTSSSSSSSTLTERYRRHLTPSLLAGKMDKYRWASLIKPDAKSFNLLLHTSTMHFRGPEGIVFADSLLQRLVEVSQTNHNDVDVPLMDVVSLATVMHGWVRHGRPDKADEWMQQLHSWPETKRDSYLAELLPNHVLYSTVLSGWARVGNAQRAMQILEWQLQSFERGNGNAQADTITFNCVLDALAKSDDSTAPEQAESLIVTMEHYATTLNWNCAPDNHTWSILLSCYTKHQPNDAEGRFAMLESLGRPLPIVAYNTMLHAYSKMGNVDAALRLLKRMESSREIAPDVISYNSVLSGYSKSKDENAPYQAEELFRHMQRQGIAPTDYSYGILMQCWSHAHDMDAADHVEQLLREMQEDPNVELNSICYTAVLKAWLHKARSFRDRRALDRAMRLFQQMVIANNRALQPSPSTIRTMIHGIVSCPVGHKQELLESLLPAMKKYGFRPQRSEENIFRRFGVSLE